LGSKQGPNWQLPSQLMAQFLIRLIRAYQRFISPLLGSRCRFYPTCSTYMEESIKRHGLLRGTGKGSWRLLRCQPFSRGGVDLP
jgi:putative membrane protein insertion efficiency factor